MENRIEEKTDREKLEEESLQLNNTLKVMTISLGTYFLAGGAK